MQLGQNWRHLHMTQGGLWEVTPPHLGPSPCHRLVHASRAHPSHLASGALCLLCPLPRRILIPSSFRFWLKTSFFTGTISDAVPHQNEVPRFLSCLRLALLYHCVFHSVFLCKIHNYPPDYQFSNFGLKNLFCSSKVSKTARTFFSYELYIYTNVYSIRN